jgi:hypothetical protein
MEKIAQEYDDQLEQHLDEGRGACWLRNPAVSAIVENALSHFDGGRYLLGSYVIMPNHVHVLVRPAMEHKLPDILQSWKSFTAKEANKALGRTGEFWQDESFDHIVRDERQLERFTRYIGENPVSARLPEGQYRLGAGLVARASRPCEPSKEHTGGTPVPLSPIRFGLAAIKGIGELAVQSILQPRSDGGRFTALSDLCERVDTRAVNRKALEALIKSGACDCFGETRATLFAQIDRTLARAASIAADRQRGQGSLFGMFQEKESTMLEPVQKLPEWPQHELLALEKELLGFYVTGHPLTPYAPLIERFCLHKTSALAELPHRSMTRIGGLIAAVQNGVSKKNGQPYAMVTLEDLEGSVQILCMNENYDRYRDLLAPSAAVLVVGEVSTGDDNPKIFPQEIMRLEDAPKKYTKQVHLRLHTAHLTPDKLDQIQAMVAGYAGRCPLFLCFRRPTGELIFVETHERFHVTPSVELQKAVDEMFGEATYYAKVDTSPPERAPRRWERKAEPVSAEA